MAASLLAMATRPILEAAQPARQEWAHAQSAQELCPADATPQRDLTRTTLGVLFIGVLIVATLWVLRPFIAPTIWATMIAVSTWPMLRWFEARLWGRRSLAVLVMSLLILMLLVVPLMLAIGTIVRHADDIVAQAAMLSGFKLPPPPPWVAGLPMVGERAAQLWEQAAATGSVGLISKLAPYADDIAKWFVAQAGSVGLVFVQFLLTVVLAALMYADGERAALAVRRFGQRLAGVYGDNVVTLAGAGHPRRGAGRRRHGGGAGRARRHRPGASPACPSPAC